MPTPIFNREEFQVAAIGAGALANQIKKETGCTFDEAWNRAREMQPAVFASMQNRVAQPQPPVRKSPSPNWEMDQRTAAQMFSEIVRLVRNRIGGTFDDAYRKVMAGNRDLFEPSYDRIRCAQGFGRLLNRREQKTGLSAVAVIERSAQEINAMALRFSPSFASAPTAFQWDILNRAAEVLSRAGVPSRIYNRATSGDASAADIAAAKSKAGDVLEFLQSTRDMHAGDDIGQWLKAKGANAHQIWQTFYAQIKTLMTEDGMTSEEAFNQLKEQQPLFWTMALLSFENGVTT